jgi:hypothetical protein
MSMTVSGPVAPLAHAPLTVLEEFLLLALDDVTSQFYDLAQSVLDAATAAALLMDLALAGRIDNDLKTMYVADPSPTGDTILDPALRVMALAPVLAPRPIGDWVRQFAEEGPALREKALRRLEAHGILRREEHRILWVFGSRRYPLIKNVELREVKMRLLGVILRDDMPAPSDIMLVALADSCGLFRHILSARDLEAAATRIAAVAKMDLVAQAVARVINEVEAGIAMASSIR